MPWQDWLDFEFFQHLVRHISGTIATIVLFAITAWIVKSFMPADMGENIEKVEKIVILGLVIILAIQLFTPLIKGVWKQIRGGWNGQILAV